MSEFDEIESLKNDSEKNIKFIDFYKDKVKVHEWLNVTHKNTIIRFKDRIEYKKNNLYHRLNGPAIDFNIEEKDIYYYKGIEYKTKEEWKKVTTKELRKIKINKINKTK